MMLPLFVLLTQFISVTISFTFTSRAKNTKQAAGCTKETLPISFSNYSWTCWRVQIKIPSNFTFQCNLCENFIKQTKSSWSNWKHCWRVSQASVHIDCFSDKVLSELHRTSMSSDQICKYSTFCDEKNRKSVQIYIPEGGIRVFIICNNLTSACYLWIFSSFFLWQFLENN